MASKKVVQTELGDKEYELLASIAEREGLTIKAAARKAILEWSMSGVELQSDPFFQLKPIRLRQKLKNTQIDGYLYRAKR